jgi:DNA-binding transcriptional LysR family regulator
MDRSVDIALLQTFLEVARTRHFGRAAARLFITQSAVSARIKHLEEQLGVELFLRVRNDIQLTADGQRLLPHASNLVLGWERARQEIASDHGRLTLGCLSDLWPLWLRLGILRSAAAGCGLRIELLPNDLLLQRLRAGLLDIGLVFDPPGDSLVLSKRLALARAVLVSTCRGLTASEAVTSGYVLIDWGPAFAHRHAQLYPDLPPSHVAISHAAAALDILLLEGGSAYLPEEMVVEHLRHGRLHHVRDAVAIERDVHLAWRQELPLSGAAGAIIEAGSPPGIVRPLPA